MNNFIFAIGDLEQDSRRDQSDSDGTFTLANILPGKYVLMAIENGWDLEWMNPSVLKPYRERGITLPLAVVYSEFGKERGTSLIGKKLKEQQVYCPR